ALLVGALAGYFFHAKFMKSSGPISHAQCTLRTGMRKLWADHVVWTRDYIIAAVAGAPDADVAAKRLLKNQKDIGDAVAQYYGNEAGEKLAALLKDHILIAADII